LNSAKGQSYSNQTLLIEGLIPHGLGIRLLINRIIIRVLKLYQNYMTINKQLIIPSIKTVKSFWFKVLSYSQIFCLLKLIEYDVLLHPTENSTNNIHLKMLNYVPSCLFSMVYYKQMSKIKKISGSQKRHACTSSPTFWWFWVQHEPPPVVVVPPWMIDHHNFFFTSTLDY
jgi:hypothetical protein